MSNQKNKNNNFIYVLKNWCVAWGERMRVKKRKGWIVANRVNKIVRHLIL